MLPYTATLPCNGIGLRNNINGILNDLRPNSMLLGVNNNPVAALQPIPLQLSVNVNNVSNKDSQWLTLEVCREYQRSMCPRNDLECKYAHPPPYIETQNGRVMCCYDSIKGKCHRIKPPCKYLHPPQHLKDLLIQNGKNNLLMKNLQMNIMQQQLSNFPGNHQLRLGFLSSTQKPNNENPKFMTSPDPTDSTFPGDHPNSHKSLHDNCSVANDLVHSLTNLNNFPNFQESQITQCSSDINSPGVHIPISSQMISDAQILDLKTSRKRALPLNNSDINDAEFQDKSIPLKKPNLLDSNLSGVRDQQSNQLGVMMAPLMAYQNQLASYLSLSNQAGLQANPMNLQTLFTPNNGNMMPFGSSLLCPNSLINVNGFPLISTIPNQQLTTTLFQAANAIQYNRGLTDFNGFQ